MNLHVKRFIAAGLVAGSILAMAGTALAKPNGDRPGWGFGDKNHTHTGPPGGPSTHPVHPPGWTPH